MRPPPRTQLWLTIRSCTELSNFSAKEAQISPNETDRIKEEMQAKARLWLAAEDVNNAGPTKTDECLKELDKARKVYFEAKRRVDSYPKSRSDKVIPQIHFQWKVLMKMTLISSSVHEDSKIIGGFNVE